ncbi:MAG: fibronectin type III domain-containing protein [Acetobacteraceae bacterium]|nr:fibronectin type III domain-containing protein [Acetobacteraceae bacterium]
MKKLNLTGWLLLVVFALGGCHHGEGSTSSPLSPVNHSAGTATLSWDAPTTTTSGAALTDLAGYRIYFGTDINALTQTVQLSGVGMQTYVIDNLSKGTWFFAVKAVTSLGVESPLSNIVSKTI